MATAREYLQSIAEQATKLLEAKDDNLELCLMELKSIDQSLDEVKSEVAYWEKNPEENK